MKALTCDAVGLHIICEYLHKNTGDFFVALNETDPNRKT
jgi:hypothetical protein